MPLPKVMMVAMRTRFPPVVKTVEELCSAKQFYIALAGDEKCQVWSCARGASAKSVRDTGDTVEVPGMRSSLVLAMHVPSNSLLRDSVCA